jgi:uncharacterized protein YaeQ
MRHAPKLWSRRQTGVVGCAVANAATLYNFKVDLADVDRGAYASLEVRVARHPSESPEYMLTRLLAYCLEYQEGIVFTDGVSAVDEPAVLVRDLTGRITAWIEVGAPSAERLHRGAKLAERCAIYTHRDPAQVLALYTGARIHRAEQIPVISFGRGYLETVAATLPRRGALAVSRTEGQLYLDVDGVTHGTTLEERPVLRPSGA